jgi:hypothetical protein
MNSPVYCPFHLRSLQQKQSVQLFVSQIWCYVALPWWPIRYNSSIAYGQILAETNDNVHMVNTMPVLNVIIERIIIEFGLIWVELP